MRKSTLQDGTPFFGIKIEHFVTKTVFANALASYCWTNSTEFNDKMSKKEAMSILNNQLFHQGREGIDRSNWDGATEEFVFPYNNAFDKACDWIDKHYPYLKPTNNGQ